MPKVTLGEHEYSVQGQPIGYLLHELGGRFGGLLEQELEGVSGAAVVPAQAHGILRVFIPSLMPLHEFLGYRSAEAMEAGEYDRAADRSPNPQQVIDAFKAASKANGGELLRHLKALVGPEMIQKFVAVTMAKQAEESLGIPSDTSEPSPSSPPTNGASAQTSSGTPAPTPGIPTAA